MSIYKLNCPTFTDTGVVLISIRNGAQSFKCTQCGKRHSILCAQPFNVRCTKELLAAAEGMADALVAYFNKRGIAHSGHKGNADIEAMADALSTYGAALAKAGRLT